MIEAVKFNTRKNNSIPLLNKDVEVIGNFFDVVPDGTIFSKEGLPMFVVRMKTSGLMYLAEHYKNKYNINIQVLEFQSNQSEFQMNSYDAMALYNKLNEKYFLSIFNSPTDVTQGFIITLTNKDRRLMHAIPIVCGKEKNECFALILDPFFGDHSSPNIYSSAIIAAKFFNEKFNIKANYNVNLYCHNTKLQADHHSCGIFAIDAIKNSLIKNKQGISRMLKEYQDIFINLDPFQNINKMHIRFFNVHPNVLKLSQFTESLKSDTIISQDSPISLNKFYTNNKIKIKYKKSIEAYNPDSNFITLNQRTEGVEIKEINSKLILKGHEYAKLILSANPDIAISNQYNPNYWIKIINNEKSDKLNIIQMIRKMRKQIH